MTLHDITRDSNESTKGGVRLYIGSNNETMKGGVRLYIAMKGNEGQRRVVCDFTWEAIVKL